MAKKQILNIKEIEKKVQELKIEVLKQPQKKKSIKKEIAKLLTSRNSQIKQGEQK
jgi:ribosomal protein L29